MPNGPCFIHFKKSAAGKVYLGNDDSSLKHFPSWCKIWVIGLYIRFQGFKSWSAASMENFSSKWGTEQLGKKWENQSCATVQRHIQDLWVQKENMKASNSLVRRLAYFPWGEETQFKSLSPGCFMYYSLENYCMESKNKVPKSLQDK